MKKQIPYGVINYAEIIKDNHYFVDKTPYLKTLERVKNPIFLRPKRFGKSMFCSIIYQDLIQQFTSGVCCYLF